MKNFFHYISSKLVLIGLVLGFFILAPAASDAQTVITEQNYVSVPTAIERLEAESSALKSQLETLVPGTAAYRMAIWKYDLFSAVLNNLYEGKTVGKSTEEGLRIYTTDVYAEMPASLKKANRTELMLIVHL